MNGMGRRRLHARVTPREADAVGSLVRGEVVSDFRPASRDDVDEPRGRASDTAAA